MTNLLKKLFFNLIMIGLFIANPIKASHEALYNYCEQTPAPLENHYLGLENPYLDSEEFYRSTSLSQYAPEVNSLYSSVDLFGVTRNSLSFPINNDEMSFGFNFPNHHQEQRVSPVASEIIISPLKISKEKVEKK